MNVARTAFMAIRRLPVAYLVHVHRLIKISQMGVKWSQAVMRCVSVKKVIPVSDAAGAATDGTVIQKNQVASANPASVIHLGPSVMSATRKRDNAIAGPEFSVKIAPNAQNTRF